MSRSKTTRSAEVKPFEGYLQFLKVIANLGMDI